MPYYIKMGITPSYVRGKCDGKRVKRARARITIKGERLEKRRIHHRPRGLVFLLARL
jgi:hypothetical protein